MKAIAGFHRCIIMGAFLFFLGGTLSAQKEGNSDVPSDAELEKYVEVNLSLRDIRRERQKKVHNAIKDSELGMKGFRRVASKQNDESAQVSEEEQKQYEATKKKIEKIQAEYRKKEKKKMKEMGMKPAKYREIAQMKMNKKVRQRIVRIKEKKMEEAQKDE